MARTPEEMAEILIELYKSSDGKKKGFYRISIDDFRRISGKVNLRKKYIFGEEKYNKKYLGVDDYLHDDGFALIDLRPEYEEFAILRIGWMNKKFQQVTSELLESYYYDYEEFEEDIDE